MKMNSQLFGFILTAVLIASCTKTEIRYVEVPSPSTTDPAATSSATITTTTVVSFSNDLRKAAASCLDSMPALRIWDSEPWSSEWERNFEKCREFRILGLAEKVDSKVLDALIFDLDEHLATVQYIISWMDQCDKAAKLEDPVNSLEYSNCGAMGIVASADLSDKRSRASQITENLQALIS